MSDGKEVASVIFVAILAIFALVFTVGVAVHVVNHLFGPTLCGRHYG